MGAGGRGRPGDAAHGRPARHRTERDREPGRARSRPGCGAAAGRRVRGGARRPGRGPSGAGAGTARRLPAVAGVRAVPGDRALPALRRSAGVAGRRIGGAPRRGCRSAAGAAGPSRGSAARRARPAGCGPGSSAPGAPRRSWAAPSPERRCAPRAAAHRSSTACPAGRTWWSPPPARNRPRRAGTGRRCCSTAGRCSHARICGWRRRRCAAGWRRRRWWCRPPTAGRVVVVADAGLPPVQALVRWDPAWHAAAELAARTEVGFPPAVRMASVEGTAPAVAEVVDALVGPELVGPGPVGPGAVGHGRDRPASARRVSRCSGRSSWIPNRAPTPQPRPGNGRWCACPARRAARSRRRWRPWRPSGRPARLPTRSGSAWIRRRSADRRVVVGARNRGRVRGRVSSR